MVIKMRHRILLAIDGSDASMKAVEYVADVICQCRAAEITLFYVIEDLTALYRYASFEGVWEYGSLEKSLLEMGKKTVERRRDEVEEKIFNPAKIILVERKTIPDYLTIHTKLAADTHRDIAQAIIEEVERGGYRTVVLGRRGRSALKEFLLGSVTSVRFGWWNRPCCVIGSRPRFMRPERGWSRWEWYDPLPP